MYHVPDIRKMVYCRPANAKGAMTYLSLFTGAGGGDLACQHLLGWTCLGYVENDDYCQRTIRQRIRDGLMHDAPQFGDIRAFIRDGYAASYSGMVDVVTAGFPCQPFSEAGNQKGRHDDRNLWPETIEAVRQVGPGLVCLENVPGLLIDPYIRTILRELADGLSDCGGGEIRGIPLSAGYCGALHPRRREWIVANADANSLRPQRFRPATKEPWSREQFERLVQTELRVSIPAGSSGGVSDGVANRMDRLKALGNGQVPRVAATAWRLLTEQE